MRDLLIDLFGLTAAALALTGLAWCSHPGLALAVVGLVLALVALLLAIPSPPPPRAPGETGPSKQVIR